MSSLKWGRISNFTCACSAVHKFTKPGGGGGGGGGGEEEKGKGRVSVGLGGERRMEEMEERRMEEIRGIEGDLALKVAGWVTSWL